MNKLMKKLSTGLIGTTIALGLMFVSSSAYASTQTVTMYKVYTYVSQMQATTNILNEMRARYPNLIAASAFCTYPSGAGMPVWRCTATGTIPGH